FKAFIKDHVVNSSSQLQRLNLYQKTLLTELVFQSVLENLQQLIAIYEKFFENLKDARVNLQTSIHQKAVQFEETADPTKKYILATKELQHNLWERIRDAETDDIIPADIAREIYVNMYEQFYKTTKKQFEARQPFDVEEFY